MSGLDESNKVDDMERSANLEYLISIWPISSTIATHLPSGDLISLSRSSKTLRSHTHGFPDHTHTPSPPPLYALHNPSTNPTLHIGTHQTPHWSTLKSLSPFACSFPSHKEPKSPSTNPNPCHACKFCSRPICKTCIVRSFFTDPKSSKLTYKHRARYLCSECWATGNMRKDFRFPADGISREQLWKGRGYGQRGHWCKCSASDDNWVCGDCRVLQNNTGPSNLALSETSIINSAHTTTQASDQNDQSNLPIVTCYGLNCTTTIPPAYRDRKRICLWCSKPLIRAYAGDDRLRWEEKQIEVRAAAAASRSADIHEWARNRFRNLTISRRELRGTASCVELSGGVDGPQHDETLFVRHLDTINYRKYMREECAPSGDSVYQSKHGRWIYSRAFLLKFGRLRHKIPAPSSDVSIQLFLLHTDPGCLKGARTNSTLRLRKVGIFSNEMILYGAQFQSAGLLDGDCLDWLYETPYGSDSRMIKLRNELFAHLATWEELDEESQATWLPPSFWDLVSAAGLSLDPSPDTTCEQPPEDSVNTTEVFLEPLDDPPSHDFTTDDISPTMDQGEVSEDRREPIEAGRNDPCLT